MNRIVNGFVSHIEAERPAHLCMPPDEFVSVAVYKVSGIAIFSGFLSAMPPVVPIVVTDMTDEVDVAAVIADEFIKAVILWVIVLRILRIPLVPFPDDSRGVTCFLEYFGERRF